MLSISAIMQPVNEMKERIDELADLMGQFKLAEAELEVDGFRVAFKRKTAPKTVSVAAEAVQAAEFVEHDHDDVDVPEVALDSKPSGTPVASPMTGIYYSAPSPGSAPFVKEGDAVSAGQVIGLIEAMKVFNEIPAPTSGIVQNLVVESGQLVNFGDPLLYLG